MPEEIFFMEGKSDGFLSFFSLKLCSFITAWDVCQDTYMCISQSRKLGSTEITFQIDTG